MKHKLRPLLMILLAASALLACAGAAETYTCGDFRYTLADDGSAVIAKYTGKDVKVRIPAELDGHSVEGIGRRAFYGCESFHSVVFPKGLTFIGDQAFAGCMTLTNLDVPAGVTVIGEEAFRDCRRLSDVTFREGLEEIGSHAFAGCNSLGIAELPDSVVRVGINPWADCRQIRWIYVSPHNPALAAIDGVLYAKADKRLICYPRARRGEVFEIPRGVRIIGDEAFISAGLLTAAVIPDTVERIGEKAFHGCGELISVTVPDSVTAIGDSAFLECPLLTVGAGRGSAAERHCAEVGIPYVYPDPNEK